MGGSSGGGSSGEVSWPEWISNLHKQGADIMFSAAASAVNPFVGVTAYDPDTEITWMSGELTNLRSAIDAFDPL
ncbi:hypothetical protein KAR91_15750, partial [Candidatus Pacearchaeota archaeon]|nr:hypothetical protein [Candidatus Pacearchaeota archaeon]